MVFSATFNNISVISWRSVLLIEETRVPRENHHVNIIHVLYRKYFNRGHSPCIISIWIFYYQVYYTCTSGHGNL